jgi:protein TonB
LSAASTVSSHGGKVGLAPVAGGLAVTAGRAALSNAHMGNSHNSANDYYQMVRTRLENQKQYPASARQRGQEGRVTVYFVIASDGGVSESRIIKASRFPVLDAAALDTIRRCVPFPSPPSDYFHGPVPLQITIVFELT